MNDQKKTRLARDAASSDGKTAIADKTASSSRGGGSDRDVGHALRSVYSTTVNETVPSELLDLLSKLD